MIGDEVEAELFVENHGSRLGKFFLKNEQIVAQKCTPDD